MSVVVLDINGRRKPATISFSGFDTYSPKGGEFEENIRTEISIRVYRSKREDDYVECQFEACAPVSDESSLGEIRAAALRQIVDALQELSKETPESLERKVQNTKALVRGEMQEISNMPLPPED